MAKTPYTLPEIVDRLAGDMRYGLELEYGIMTKHDHSVRVADGEGGTKPAPEMYGMVAATAKQATKAEEAFRLWDDLIASSLKRTDDWSADITLAYSSTTTDDGSYLDPNDGHGRVWLSSDWNSNKDAAIDYGRKGFSDQIHEIGHALGLEHPGNYNAGPGKVITYDKDAVYLQDTSRFTIMSYFGADTDANGDPNGAMAGDPNGYVDADPGADHTISVRVGRKTVERFIEPSTPMLHDIAAIQWMYGADLETRTTDTIYGFNNDSSRDAFDFTKNPNPVVTIYDAGGEDTLDLSGYTKGQVVDLRPGQYSSVGNGSMTNNLAMSFAVDSTRSIEGLHSDFDASKIVNYIENAVGGSGNDDIFGNATANKLYGEGGNDTLNGSTGADQMWGGAGNDVYYVDDAGDRVSEFVLRRSDAGGIDEVRVSGSLTSFKLGTYVENLTYVGPDADFVGTGNILNNTIKGGSGNDTLDGGAGNDILRGGEGNDTYIVDSADDQAIEYVRTGVTTFRDTGGIDEVRATAPTFALGRYVENLTNTGTGAFHGIGNGLANVLRGGSGNDTLEGGAGNDTFYGGGGTNRLVGGADNDTYHLGTRPYYGSDTVMEDANGGTDSVVYHAIRDSILNFHTLADNVENLTIAGTYNGRGTGNGLDNVLIGNAGENTLRGLAGNDTLDGGGGFDTLIGGAGNDTYRVSSTIYQKADTIVEDADGGIDTVIYTPLTSLASMTPSYTLGDNLENLTIGGALAANGIGNAASNVMFGNSAANTLRGLGGNDTLNGGFAAAADSRGSDGNDIIDGGAGNDLIIVSYGADIIDGGIDTDTLSFAWVGAELNVDLSLLTTTFRESGSWAEEFGGGGWSSLVTVTWSGIENLTGGLGNDVLAGNFDANHIEGGDGNDTINGGTGNDTLDGGLGSDTYVFANNWGSDTIADFADGAERLDMRQVTGLWSIDQFEIEYTAAGAKITFAGNTILLTGIAPGALTESDFLLAPRPIENLVIAGTEGNDVLAGGLGADTISGLGGSDVLRNIDGTDTVNGGTGYDYVYAGAHTDAAGFTFTVAGTNVDYINASEGNDVIDSSGVSSGYTQMHGDAGNDLFRAGDGIEWMFGGMGKDTAVFSGNRADYTIVEDQWEWTGWTGITNNTTGVLDWIISVETVQFADMTIDAPGQRPEIAGTAGNDTLAGGDAAEQFFGASGDDELNGGGGNDIMVGGAGADKFIGGAGSDVFYIDNDDTLIDGGAGFDYVFADDSKGPIGIKMDFAGTSIENIWGGMGNDVIDVSGVTPGEFSFGVNVTGASGDDTIIGSLYTDYIVGDEGTDTVVYAGNRAGYTIEADGRNQAGGMKVTEIATGVSDWLDTVEQVRFADGTWPLHA